MLFTENSLTLIASHLFALTWSFSKFFLLFVCLFFLQLGVLLISGKLTYYLLLKFTISHLERELSLELKLVIFPVTYHLFYHIFETEFSQFKALAVIWLFLLPLKL